MSKTLKHNDTFSERTPGIWYISDEWTKEPDVCEISIKSDAENSKRIARIRWNVLEDDEYYRQMNANFTLISAAPELAEALHAALLDKKGWQDMAILALQKSGKKVFLPWAYVFKKKLSQLKRITTEDNMMSFPKWLLNYHRDE